MKKKHLLVYTTEEHTFYMARRAMVGSVSSTDMYRVESIIFKSPNNSLVATLCYDILIWEFKSLDLCYYS